MDSVARFGAIFTKVKALESRMLSTADYQALLRAESEQQVVHYLLHNSEYGKAFKKAEQAESSLISVERALHRYLFDRYEQMMYYVIDADRKLFKTLLMRYEIESLKMVIRTVYSQIQHADIELNITTSQHFQIQDFDKLLSLQSLDQLVDSLMTTDYGAILKPYLGESKSRMLFYMEMNLDRYYFKRLYDSILRLKGAGREFMETAFGTNVDLLNVQWIYRGQKHYDLSAEELFNYCLKGGLNLNLTQLKALCYAADSKAFNKILMTTRYKTMFNSEASVDLVLERDMERTLYNLFRKQVKEAHLNLITPVAYLHSLEFEIRDLFAIIEAKRYKMNAEQTRTFLVRQI